MPPRRVKILARVLSRIAAHAPWLWPLVKRPVERFWNRMAAGWDTGASPERMTAFAAALDHVGEPRRILEVGTGTGSGAALLVERFPDAEVVGVDLSREMVERARAKVPRARFEVADASSLPLHDASVDLVAQNNVPVYFKELARVLAPGGRVLIVSTMGPATPYYTPHSVLRRGFEKLGFTEIRAEQAPPGDWFTARRP
jgi:SAM-dependent methyltransferase